MATEPSSFNETKDEEMELFISPLPTTKGWLPNQCSYKYGGHYWLGKQVIQGVFIAQKNYNPQPNTLILATFPKCGTTWFTALLFTTINRTRYDFVTHPLLNSSPHECVPWLELYIRSDPTNVSVKSSKFPIFKTHIPYNLLSEFLKSSTYPIVYVSRNPMDTSVSLWHYMNKMRPREEPLGLNEAFEMFCQGVAPAGPYWDHVLSYWKASLEMPNKVLFVRYEDMKLQSSEIMKKLAKFIGCSFSIEEEQDGMIEKIVEFCSFESLTSFKVNQDGVINLEEVSIMKNSFFRKGEVGDYKNYLTDDMINRLKEITNKKFKGSGLDVFS